MRKPVYVMSYPIKRSFNAAPCSQKTEEASEKKTEGIFICKFLTFFKLHI